MVEPNVRRYAMLSNATYKALQDTQKHGLFAAKWRMAIQFEIAKFSIECLCKQSRKFKTISSVTQWCNPPHELLCKDLDKFAGLQKLRLIEEYLKAKNTSRDSMRIVMLYS